MSEQQNFSNHVKLVPAFHFFLLPVLMANLIWAIVSGVHVLRSANLDTWAAFGLAFRILLALALVALAFLARVFALGVQDRVIRLEERLRCEQASGGFADAHW